MSKAKLRMVKVILHWVWDPIGVRGLEGAVDEYGAYAPHVLELLERGSSDAEVAAYLRRVESEWMELQPHRDRSEDVAALLTQMHAVLTEH
jgi:hypothetical protein